LTLISIGSGFIESIVGTFGIGTCDNDGTFKLGKLEIFGKFGAVGTLGNVGKLGMGGINCVTLSVRSFTVGNPNWGIGIKEGIGNVFSELSEYFAQSMAGFSNFKPETRLSGSTFEIFLDVLLIKLLTLLEIPPSGFLISIDGGCGKDIIYFELDLIL